jgi:hypothetical protein
MNFGFKCCAISGRELRKTDLEINILGQKKKKIRAHQNPLNVAYKGLVVHTLTTSILHSHY